MLSGRVFKWATRLKSVPMRGVADKAKCAETSRVQHIRCLGQHGTGRKSLESVR